MVPLDSAKLAHDQRVLRGLVLLKVRDYAILEFEVEMLELFFDLHLFLDLPDVLDRFQGQTVLLGVNDVK